MAVENGKWYEAGSQPGSADMADEHQATHTTKAKEPVRRYLLASVLAMVWAVSVPVQSVAQSLPPPEFPEVEFGSRKIFLMLFLMLGPIKILVPFKVLAGSYEPSVR